MTKDEIQKMLAEKLNEITESVIKKLNKTSTGDDGNSNADGSEKKTDDKKMNKSVKDSDSKKNDNKKNSEKDSKNDSEKDSEIVTVLKSLQAQVNTLTDKIDSGVKTAEDVAKDTITKNKAEVESQMIELVKSMGIDTDNVDVDFVIKEKKKSKVSDDDSDDKFSKDEKFSPDSEDFEKAFDKLDEDEKEVALGEFFKGLLK